MTSFTRMIPGLVLAVSWSAPAQEQPASALPAVVTAVEEVDQLRRTLVTSFDPSKGEITEETFARVCKPVGLRAQEIAKEHGWKFQQLAVKNRNPNNAADAEAKAAIKAFEKDAGLQGSWRSTEVEGRKGIRYFRRITVQQACLACHGEEDSRPSFIVKKYPGDKAHGFKPGDLRGVYSVFVPAAD